MRFHSRPYTRYYGSYHSGYIGHDASCVARNLALHEGLCLRLIREEVLEPGRVMWHDSKRDSRSADKENNVPAIWSGGLHRKERQQLPSTIYAGRPRMQSARIQSCEDRAGEW